MERSVSNLLPSLVEEGVFGDVKLVDMEYTNDKDIGAQFGSSLNFVTLKVKGTTEECLKILIKTPVSLREDSLSLFQMELFMYKEVLPHLGYNQEWYPKFYYGIVDRENLENSVLIFDNLKHKKYNSKIQICLDYDHISVAMKNIAKFHSLSFLLKHGNPEKFEELTKKMQQHYKELPKNIKLKSNVDAQIAIRAFEEEHGKEEVLDKFSKIFDDVPLIIEHLSTPQEPFSVICHGDFCNNNVMYKYNQDGSPIDCAFIDFQMSKYSSLVTDLSFFLYLNTDFDIREKYWDQFLNIYWETLRESVPNHIDLPSFESFLAHFSQFAVYGFNISSFFLQIMMDPLPLSEIVALTEEEQNERRSSPKGLEIRGKVMDMVSHVYHKGYIQEFLDYMNKSLNAD